MAGNLVGGRLFVTIEGVQYSPRGAFEIMPGQVEREAGSNHDGTLWINAKPVPAEASGSLSYSDGLDIVQLSEICGANITFELENGDTYIFANAAVVDRPSLNTETGEISGFRVVSDSVSKA